MCHSLKILLRLLVHEVASGYGPSLGFLRERHGSECREIGVVGCTHREVAHELEIANAVGSQLKIAHGKAMSGWSTEGLMVDGLDGEGETSAVPYR